MAQGTTFSCPTCGFSVEAWDDGNPYYRDDRGRKRYAYHPDHNNLTRCIGNDEPHLCMDCGVETKVDSLKPRTTCLKCGGQALVDSCKLDGLPCPRCRKGVFEVRGTAIS